MGTFERIRQISPWAFGIFAVLLTAYFVFTSGAEDIVRQQTDPSTAVIAEVNGEEIFRSEFENLVRERMEQERQQAEQKGEDTEIDDKQIRATVFNELIERKLMEQYANRAGIFVTDDEIADYLIETPPQFLQRAFTDTSGTFNKQLYQKAVTDPESILDMMGPRAQQMNARERQQVVQDFRNDLIMVENMIREQKLQQSLTTAVFAAKTVISPEYAKDRYIAQNGSADVNYISFPISEIGDNEVEVTDEELREYYDKMKKYYEREPQAKIRYVNFPIVPSESDTASAERKINRIVEMMETGETLQERDSIFDDVLDKFGGETHDFSLVKDISNEKRDILLGMKLREVTGPVKLFDGTYFFRLDGEREGEQAVVKASHILISFGNDKDSAKAEAERIYRLAKGGENFAKLAAEYSQDPGSARKGGDVGYFGKGQMVQPFEEAAFAANPGDIVGPVESRFGYHIIKVVDKKSKEIAYSEISVTPRVSSITRNILKRDAISFKNQVEDGTPFDTMAARIEKTPLNPAFFTKERPVLGSMYIAHKAFELDEGEMIGPIELEDFGFVVAQVVEKRGAGFQDMEELKRKLTLELKDKKKLDMIKPKAEKAYKELASAGNIDAGNYEVQIAQGIKNNGMLQGAGQEFAFTAAAFNAPMNKVYGPVRGDKGYYILTVLNRDIPDSTDIANNLPGFITKLQQGMAKSAYYQWFTDIKKKAEIVDYRSKYYRDY